MNTLNYPGKLVNPQSSNLNRVYHPVWGIVTKPQPLYGPDVYGAKYRQISYEYEAVKGRTVVKFQPVVDDPTKKRT